MATRQTKKKSAYTVFDTIYRTMVQKYPQLVIPLINELFGTSYDANTDSQQLRNEQLTLGKKLVTDSLFRIQDTLYHIECQSTPDGTMAIRMFEYDAMIAIDGARHNPSGKIRFPMSGVLYLRHTANTPDTLELQVVFPDQQEITYQVPVIKAKEYTIDELFHKKLLMILPFYIMRYENILQAMDVDSEQAKVLLNDLYSIISNLEHTLVDDEHIAVFLDLADWITTISDYLLKKQPKLRKEVQSIMGGKILQTRSEKIFKQGQKSGVTVGIEAGKKAGKLEGIQESLVAFTKTLLMMRQPYEFIAQATKTSVEDVKRIAEEEGLAY